MTKKTTVVTGNITLAEAKNPTLAAKKRREKEAAELEARRQLEIAHRNKNIVREPRKQSMKEKMEAAALARQTEQEVEQGVMRTIPSPKGSLYARVEPDLVREVVELTWAENYHMGQWRKDKDENGIEHGERWTATMSEQWDLCKSAAKARKLLAPKGGALSGCFWGAVVSSLVGETPLGVDAFRELNKVPLETYQLFLETWAEMIDEDEHNQQCSSSGEVDDAGLQNGGMTDRGCYIGDNPKLTNATAATGIGRSA
tara:strand:- start:1431 stop:2201 length:771 start_codon:yes stop_codon:yes gene_type:complete